MKKLLYLLIFLGIGGKHVAQVNDIKVQRVDDFALHVYAGAAVNIGVTTALYAKTKKIGLACATGFLSAVFVGGAKEMIHDKMMKRGTPTIKDFLATAWGATIAFPIVRSGIDIYEKKKMDEEYFQFLGDSIRQTLLTRTDTAIMLNNR